jgi:hypothetical protein
MAVSRGTLRGRLPSDEPIQITRTCDAPRHAMVTDDGVEVAFLGEHREIVPEYPSRQERDAHVEYMQDGLQEAMDLLEQAALDLARGQGACPCAG